MVDWVISRHIAASWRGSPGAHAAVPLGDLQLGGDRIDEDLLAGAEAFGDVDHGQFGRGVQHRHDDVVVAEPFGDTDDPLDKSFAAAAADGTSRSTPTIRAVSSAASSACVSGQRR